MFPNKILAMLFTSVEYLSSYTVAGNEGPAVLLVHGFGAFLEHYRDNVDSIVNSRNRVWTITVLGFGKSEKPNIVYTELLWSEMLRDFMIEVVGEPAHCVGNSIGGYFVSLMAFLWPDLVKSVILVNSAGNVIPGYSPLPISKERRVPFGAQLGARLLILFLRFNVKKLLKDCYPVKPERADEFLITEMLRASQDPGVVMVLESIFGFDLSRPLNYLLKGFEEKTLVIQGMKDPISDPRKKVALLKEFCPGMVIKKVNAGHCPHDEIPEEVNHIICEWIAKVDNNEQQALKSLIPKPERADEFLITEMLRASQDPGVVMVLESIFGFDLSRPLNYLLKGFEEKTLVIQGMKDPISDPRKKVALLKEFCPGMVIKKVNAGHCPHDEIPEEVNHIICEWIAKVDSQ
ncbi:hypothetical protein F2Q69_00057343 [Brassica cretica]|uniref:AB hydrolase-1 domain-containing protein n=1 Tax=Brassica cretica TaxID=69181 RepID=A0A8S9N0B2_BRACR|nr:hypothetical protein F2Q69_00057343 [Brassica cretica]